jgi:hypothetical protein
MTFWPAYKVMRSITAGQNVAEKKPTKALAPTGVFRSPSRLTGGEAYTDLLNAVFLLTPMLFLYFNLMHDNVNRFCNIFCNYSAIP